MEDQPSIWQVLQSANGSLFMFFSMTLTSALPNLSVAVGWDLKKEYKKYKTNTKYKRKPEEFVALRGIGQTIADGLHFLSGLN